MDVLTNAYQARNKGKIQEADQLRGEVITQVTGDPACQVLMSLQAEVDTLNEDQRRSVLSKAMQLESLAFELGSAPQICAALLTLYEKPLIRELMGRRLSSQTDALVKEQLVQNAFRFLLALKTKGTRCSEDDNATRVVLTALCQASMGELKYMSVSAVARILGMSWELVNKCCILRGVFNLENTGELHRGWKRVRKGTYSNKLKMGEVIAWCRCGCCCGCCCWGCCCWCCWCCCCCCYWYCCWCCCYWCCWRCCCWRCCCCGCCCLVSTVQDAQSV